MAYDGSGNWYPLLPDGPPFTTTWPSPLAGTGAPDAGLGDNGDSYVDLATGDFYLKVNDSWVLSVGGGGGIEGQYGNYAGGEPDFTPSTSVALAYDTSTDPATEWIWHSNAWH